MPKRYFKSGMGNDVDLIRLSLILLTGILAINSYQRHSVTFLLATIFSAAVVGWWVTRAYYLDMIEGLKAQARGSENRSVG